MKKIAVVILTKNEEKNIVAVIENVRKITDEIIIIDSGSDDATVGLANLHGARVLYRKWDNDFSAQRNFVLDKTDADYILYIDADERLSFELIESVKNAVDKCEAKQYSFMRKIEAFDFGYNHGIFAPDEVIRLFSGSGRKLILVPVCLVLPSFGSNPSSSSMVGIPRS